MPLYGFVGETHETLVRGRTYRRPPFAGVVPRPDAVWTAPHPGLDVWVGVVRLTDDAAATALETAVQAAGLRCRVFAGFDGAGETLGPVRAALLNLVLTQRGLGDVSTTNNENTNTLIDRLAARIGGVAHSRAKLLAEARRRGLDL